MAKINATDVKILISDVEIGNLTNVTLEVNRDMIDVTTKDSAAWKQILVGLRDWSMSGDITVDFTDTYAADDVTTALIAGTAVSVKFTTGDAGFVELSGSGYYSQQSFEAGTEDKYTSKFNIMGNGAITATTLT